MGKKTDLISPEIMFQRAAAQGCAFELEGGPDAFVMCTGCEEWELVYRGEWYYDYEEEKVYCDMCWRTRFNEKRRAKDMGTG